MKKRLCGALMAFFMTLTLFPAAALDEIPGADINAAAETAVPRETPEPLEATADPIPEPPTPYEATTDTKSPKAVKQTSDSDVKTAKADSAILQATVIKSGNCGAYGSNVTWTLDSDGVLTISGTGKMKDFLAYSSTIPWDSQRSDIKTVVIIDSVTSIGEWAFSNCDGLTSVTIGNSVTSIGENAFSRCSSLTSVTIPDSVTSIGNFAFKSCTSLTSVTIGNSVTSIGEYAFESCSSLTSVTIPDSVTEIGYGAFSGCSNLTSVTIPDSVTEIGYGAFSGCSNLTSVTIPDSVTEIGGGAFSGCASLTSINVDSANRYYESANGVLFNKNSINLIRYPASKTDSSYEIPDSVTEIVDYAFSDCSGLTSVTIPDSVTEIGYGAFSDCSGLTSVTIPDGVTSIKSYTFSGCAALTSVTIPDSVTEIGKRAFSGCAALTSVTIPDGVTEIGEEAFSDCSGLTSVTIPDGVTSIGDSMFSGCAALTSVTIPDSVTEIGKRAFYRCAALTSVTIPDSVTEIGEYAFYFCAVLTSVTIPDGVTAIRDSTFSSCHGLTSVTIPDSVTSIGYSAFVFCNSLKDIYYAGDESQWSAIAFGINNYCLTDVVIHYKGSDNIGGICGSNNNGSHLRWTLDSDGLLTVSGTGAMKNYTNADSAPWQGQNSNIKTVVITDGVTSISKYAFHSCAALTSVTISDGVTSIGSYAFRYCISLTSVTIPSSATSIESYAFYSCSSLTSVTIPDSVTSIGEYAFSRCESLTSVTIPDSVTSVGSYAFYDCESLTSMTIPNGVISIGSYAFSRCAALTSVNIPASVTSIGDYAFSRCAALTSVTISASVTSIGDYMFLLCQNLKGVAIGGGVTSVGKYAFFGCNSLKDVYYAGNETQWNAITIGANNAPLTGATIHYNSDLPAPMPTPAAVTGIRLDETAVTLNIGEHKKLSEIITPENATDQTVTWASYNASVAEVSDDGTVTARNPGATAITATTRDGNYTAACAVTVTSPQIKEIEITPPTRTTFPEGSPLDVTGLVVRVVYQDGAKAEVTDYTLSGYQNTVGTHTITVNFNPDGKNHTATFNVTVEPVLTGIKVTAPTKTAYRTGEYLNLSGMIVTGIYSDDSEKTVSEGYLITGYNAARTGVQAVTVSWEEFSAQFSVTVSDASDADNNAILPPRMRIAGYPGGKRIDFSHTDPDAVIYYTKDGSAPSAASTLYNENNPIRLTERTTIKAVAIKNGTSSSVVSGLIAVPKAADPVISHASGSTLIPGTIVTLKSADSDASFYYTTDGSDPNLESARYGGGILIDKSMTVKAIAVKDGYTASDSIEATYYVQAGETRRNSAVIAVGHVDARAGENISDSVSIFTEGDAKVTGFRFTVQYDKHALEYISVSPIEGESSSKLFASEDRDNGTVTILCSDVSMESGEVCALNFKAFDSGEDGEYELSVAREDISIGTDANTPLAISFESGSVKLTGSRNSQLTSETMYTTGDGETLSDTDGLSGGDVINANIVIDAPSGGDQLPATANVFLAIYDEEGMMVSLDVWEISLSDLQHLAFMQTVRVPLNIQVSAVKTMILSDELTPLMAAAALDDI